MSPATADHAPPPAPGPRRVWFPIAWVLGLLGLFVVAKLRSVDQGVVNFVAKLAVAMGVIGLAVWVLRSSGLRSTLRWPLAIVPCLLLLAFYQQWWPLEAVMDGDAGIVGWRWRWEEPDQTLATPTPAAEEAIPWEPSAVDYPGYLGQRAWPEATDAGLVADWSAEPPKQLWRQQIGAGWSGFAVAGRYAITQEQRGPDELVVAYDLLTGNVIWSHADPVRWDPRGPGALGGVGPRATPTIHNGRVYAHGATGLLNCLNAASGVLLWSHDTLKEHRAENVVWGKAGSPLVVDDLVIVSVGGPDGKSLVAYDQTSGEVAWSAGSRRASYATPTSMTLAGVRQVVCVNEDSVTAHDRVEGTVLWEHPWPSSSGAAAATSQPIPVGENRVLLTKGYGLGAEVIEVSRDRQRWTTKTVWKRPVLKTKMTNAILYEGHALAISDGQILQCVDLESGRVAWRHRRRPRFGHGQLLLAGDLVFIMCESGEVILIEAAVEEYRELASFPALDGVTWNTPALVGAKLLVRNAEEAACYELSNRAAAIQPADEARRRDAVRTEPVAYAPVVD